MFSMVNAMVANAENRPQSAIFFKVVLFITHPVIGGSNPPPDSGVILSACGAQYIEPLFFNSGQKVQSFDSEQVLSVTLTLILFASKTKIL